MIVTRQFELEFRKDGSIFDEAQVGAILGGIDAAITNLVFISHGWNNNREEATALYDAFVASLERIAATKRPTGIEARRVALVRILWPSKKFEDSDLIPGGGAAAVGTAEVSDATTIRLLDALKRDPVRLGEQTIDAALAVHVDTAAARLAHLDTPEARRDFVLQLRAILNPDARHADDGSDAFFTSDAEVLFQALSKEVPFAPAVGAGGATTVGMGPAAGLGDVFSGIKAAARRIVNFATYYQMKSRAGTVGLGGVAQVLARVRAAFPALPLTLVGHSFGGRLVTAAASTLPPGSAKTSMMLLQAAYSHNGLSADFDHHGHPGAFRTVVGDRRIGGPILITHTKNDKAVGIAYPLASRIANDRAAAFGDENDPYGGMGRNGAQQTAEAIKATLEAAGTGYAWNDGAVYNLRGDQISGHSDVTGPDIAWAFAHLLVR